MIRENKDINEQSLGYDLWLYIKKTQNKPTTNKSKSLLLPHVNLFSPLVHSHQSVFDTAVADFQHS